MATVSTTINEADGWVLVEGTGSNAIIQCTNGYLKVTFSATAPAQGSTNYHLVEYEEYIERIGVDNVYVSTDFDGSVVTVTT